MSVPPVEAIHLEGPESAPAVARDDQAVGIAYVHAEHSVHAANQDHLAVDCLVGVDRDGESTAVFAVDLRYLRVQYKVDPLPLQGLAHRQDLIAGRPVVLWKAQEQTYLPGGIGCPGGRKSFRAFHHVANDSFSCVVFKLGFLCCAKRGGEPAYRQQRGQPPER